MDDKVLVADALAKGPEAFGPIVKRYQDTVFSVALARVRNFHEAEDIAQAVFVDAFVHLDRLQDADRLGPWLRTMAINKGIDWLRRRRDHVDVEAIANDPRHAQMPQSLQDNDEMDRVMTAIARLGTAQQETITLHYLGGYSVQEIADIQGAPAGTVKTRLFHGRRALKRDLVMVETTLTSGAAPQDLAQRVFDTLSRHDRRGQEIFGELRQLGAGRAIEGFVRAAEAKSPDTRRQASYFAASFAAENPAALDVVKRGLQDRNRHVRRFSVMALRHLQVSDEVMRTEVLPLAMELLFDKSLYVRQRISGFLEDRAADVPLPIAARALLEERSPRVRGHKENLLRAVLTHHAGDSPRIQDSGLDEQIAALQEALASETAGHRTRAVSRLLGLAMRHPERTAPLVDLVVGALKDRAKRVRWRAALELLPWAAEVDPAAVQAALDRETNDNARASLERLLEGAKKQQN